MNQNVKKLLLSNAAWIAFFLLVAILVVATKGEFVSARNLTNLIRQASINGILATGMTLVILTGGIDLSIGSVVALVGVCVGLSQSQWGWQDLGTRGALLSLVLALGVGSAAGFLNGALVAALRIAPFVITLGMMVIARGLALIFSGGSSISPMGDELTSWAESYFGLSLSIGLWLVAAIALFWQARQKKAWAGLVFSAAALLLFGYGFFQYRGVPYLVFFLALSLGAAGFLLGHTTWGRGIFAIGSNEKAAYWAGVPIRRVIFFVYGAMGLLAGLAGTLLTARLNGADPNAGQLFELDAIAAVVIGGTSLKGGSGSIQGSLIGALIIAGLNNGMDLLSVPSFYQMVFKGLIIVSAVAVDRRQATV